MHEIRNNIFENSVNSLEETILDRSRIFSTNGISILKTIKIIYLI